ncbi:MAG TPA: zf-HC2 domain-containing protein [Mycobacteriales bacterium]|nr:zf-HC2 domain-containing protein [Mycobacteriales bacterium]
MTSDGSDGRPLGRVCTEVQRHLPAHVRGELGRSRRRLVTLHTRGCGDCRTALERQLDVRRGLTALAPALDLPAEPPAGLLDTLLASAASPGVAGRAAVPARGAVSGARPVLSLALLVAGAAVGTGAGYAGWRAVRRVGARRR